VEQAFTGRLESQDPPPVITLSNLGSKGVDLFTGVIAMGQPLLLTVGRIALRPVVVDGNVMARFSLFATMNVDHRRFDGEHAAELLAAFAAACLDDARLQGPEENA
jgi:pyruvate dehydrogenase E2 component (dihydrolipoamide acetyltransferase)